MPIIFFLLLFLFCPTAAFAQSSNFKIGLNIPLSGPLAEYGVAVKNAFTLAAEELGAEGYEMLYEDNQFDGKAAVTALETLTEIKKVDLVYLWGEPCLYAVAPMSDKKRIPILSMSVDKRSAQNHNFIFRTINPSEDFIRMIFTYLRSNTYEGRQFKKFGILMAEDPYFEGLLEEIKVQALPQEEILVVGKVPSEHMDLKTELIKAKAAKLDALAVYLFPGQVSSTYKAMRNLKYSVPTIGTDIFESATEVKDSQGTMLGAKYHNLQMPEEFGVRYLNKFGNDLQVSYAYNAYTTAKFLISKVKALKLAKQNGSDLKDEIEKLLLAEKGLPFEVKKDGEFGYYFSYPIVIKEVEKNGFSVVR